MRTLVFTCLAGLAALHGQAQTVCEPFDYAPESGLIGQTHPSGLTWLAAGSGPEQPGIQVGDLAVPGLAAPAGHRVRIRPGSGPSARLPFDNAATNGTLFFSLALRTPSLDGLDANGEFFAGFTPAAGAQATTPSNMFTRALIRAAPGGYQLGLGKSAAQPGWSPTPPFGSNDTVFLVGSYTFSVGPGNDLARLWVNPDAGTLGAADPPSPTLSSVQGQDASQLASWVLCQRPAPGLPALLQVDELRIGPTWASVTPPGMQNEPPSVSNIPDQTVSQDGTTGPLAFTVRDAETPAGGLTLAAASTNEMLMPVANVIFGGSGSNRSVTLTPAPDKFGTTLITITVSDGKASASASFVLTVTPGPDVRDLRVRLLSETAEPTVGHSFRFLVTVDNLGATAEQNVGCIISVPTNLPFSPLRAISSHGSNHVEGNVVTWNLGQLLPQQTAATEILLAPAQAGNFEVNAALSFVGQDDNPQNDVARLLVSVRPSPNRNSVTPQPVRLSLARAAADRVALEWLSQSNVIYRLECTSDLGARHWQTLSTFRGNGTRLDWPVQVGERTQFYRVVADSPLPWLGSWGQYVKTNSVEEGAWRDHIPSLVQALRDTGQNFCIYPMDEEIDWNDFKLLLEEAPDLRIFAAITAPHLGGGANGKLLWFNFSYADGKTNGDDYTNCSLPTVSCDCTDFADYVACERDYIEKWLDAWKNAARCLSSLSLSYPNLVGYVINDFDTYVESVDFPSCIYGKRLTRDDVAEIAEATHSPNPDFQFWPTCYYQDFGKIMGNGYVLGANYGVKLWSDDEMRVDLSFNLDRLPLLATLEFFHGDTVARCTPWYVFRRVYLNDNLLWDESVGGDQIIQRFSQVLTAGDFNTGDNTLSFVLDPISDTENTDCSEVGVFWRIWDVSLNGISLPSPLEPPELFSASFSAQYSTTPHPVPYSPACRGGVCGTSDFDNTQTRGDCAGLPNDSTNGFARGRLVAAPNEPYLIHDLVDGIVAPFYRTQTLWPLALYLCPIGGSLAFPYSPYSYDSDDYRSLLESTQDQLQGAGLMALHLGMDLWTNSLDLANLEDQLQISASVADYTGLWNMPLGIQYLDEQAGIFNDRRNAAGVASFAHTNAAGVSIDWNFLAYWPSRQNGVPGWYVRWHSVAGSSRKCVVAPYDTIEDTADPNAYKGLIQKVAVYSLSTRTTNTLFSYDLAEIVPDAVLATWPMTITLGDFESLELSVEQDLTRNPPSSSAAAYFYVTDELGTPVGADSRDDWWFETGVEAKVIETFTVETNVFWRLRK